MTKYWCSEPSTSDKRCRNSHVVQSVLPVLCFILVVRSAAVYTGRILTSCFLDIHMAGWLSEDVTRALYSSSSLRGRGGCCVTKRQNQGSLNPDGTPWDRSGIKPGFQRLVFRVQLYCATKFTFLCCSEDFKGSDEISTCVKASSERSLNLRLIFISCYFLRVSAL